MVSNLNNRKSDNMSKISKSIEYLELIKSNKQFTNEPETLDVAIQALKEKRELRNKISNQTNYLRNVSGWGSGCKYFKGLDFLKVLMAVQLVK